jgi:oxygen-independent coproporphyrinogen-3 oxidase
VHSLTRQEEVEEAWFLGLRLNAGVSLCQIEAEFGREVVELYAPILEALAADDLLTGNADQIALTTRGQMLSNEVFERFLGVIEIPEPATV